MSALRKAASTRRALVRQERLLPFLQNPASYPHGPRRVRLIQTHSSFVFIAPPYVYKVKKPVNFGFLDFSTLEARRRFCEREVTLNRRLSPGIYLGVVPICDTGRGFAFGNRGRVVEYCVRMRHLSESRFLSRLLQRQAVGKTDITRIVETLARFYQEQTPTPEVERWGRIDRLRISTDENFRQTRLFVGATLSRAAFDALRRYTEGFYERHRALLESRPRHGWIRDCHGDLHADHVHLTPRRVSIYDCIEFNDRFRCVDVASDVAFLAMDLDFAGRPDLARQLLAKMGAALQDDAMSRLADFYKLYRAYVRGKVESLHAHVHAATAGERTESVLRAQSYFRLALRYAVGGSHPVALVILGPPGSGKSTLARALGAELGWSPCSTDVLRKQSAGLPLLARPDDRTRRRLYSPKARRATYVQLLRTATGQLRDEGGVILDATFGDPARRRDVLHWARRNGIRLLFLEAWAPARTRRRRLAARNRTNPDASDARLRDLPTLNRLYRPPAEIPHHQRLRIDTGSLPDRAVSRALTLLVDAALRASER